VISVNAAHYIRKLFKSLEAFGRKPPEKSIVQKVVNAYELLGMEDEKERVMQKYSDLLSQTRKEADEKKKSRKAKSTKNKSSGNWFQFRLLQLCVNFFSFLFFFLTFFTF